MVILNRKLMLERYNNNENYLALQMAPLFQIFPSDHSRDIAAARNLGISTSHVAMKVLSAVVGGVGNSSYGIEKTDTVSNQLFPRENFRYFTLKR